MYAASMGHRVIAFEPLPKHTAAIRRTLELNGPILNDRVWLHERIVNNNKGGKPMGIHAFPIGPSGSAFASSTTPGGLQVSSVRIDDVARGQAVDMMKIDTEGCEIQVLLSAMRLISDGKLHNALIEVCPYLWERCSASLDDAE